MAITPRGIVTPDMGDGYDLVVDLANMADSIDSALDGIDVTSDVTTIQGDIADLQEVTGVRNFRWADATERAAQTGMEEGDRGYQEDTGVEYWYSGSEWLVNLPGLNLIVPESVAGTGTTVNDRGVVTLASATSCSINGVFTSRFTNYLVKVDITNSGASLTTLVLRASGTNATTAYDWQYHYGVNTTSSAGQSLNQASIPLQPSGLAARLFGEVELFGPQLSEATALRLNLGVTPNPMTTLASIWTLIAQHRTTTAYDGFTITPSTGTLTGTIRVYGYNE